MNTGNNRSQLIKAIADLDEDLALKNNNWIVFIMERSCFISSRLPGWDAISGVKKYENKQYYLSGLIMGGEIFSQAMQFIRPSIVDKVQEMNPDWF